MTVKIISELFRTAVYEITIKKSGLTFRSAEREIKIPFGEIKEISVSQGNNGAARLEITAEKESISGVFNNNDDSDEFARTVREKSGKALQSDLRFQQK
jgi:hypothetical protein